MPLLIFSTLDQSPIFVGICTLYRYGLNVADNLAILNCSYFKKKKKKYKLFINVLPQRSTCTQLMTKLKKTEKKEIDFHFDV